MVRLWTTMALGVDLLPELKYLFSLSYSLQPPSKNSKGAKGTEEESVSVTLFMAPSPSKANISYPQLSDHGPAYPETVHEID